MLPPTQAPISFGCATGKKSLDVVFASEAENLGPNHTGEHAERLSPWPRAPFGHEQRSAGSRAADPSNVDACDEGLRGKPGG